MKLVKVKVSREELENKLGLKFYFKTEAGLVGRPKETTVSDMLPESIELTAELVEYECEHEWQRYRGQHVPIDYEKCLKCRVYREGHPSIDEQKPNPRLLAPALIHMDSRDEWQVTNELFYSKEEVEKKNYYCDKIIWPARLDSVTGGYIVEDEK